MVLICAHLQCNASVSWVLQFVNVTPGLFFCRLWTCIPVSVYNRPGEVLIFASSYAMNQCLVFLQLSCYSRICITSWGFHSNVSVSYFFLQFVKQRPYWYFSSSSSSRGSDSNTLKSVSTLLCHNYKSFGFLQFRLILQTAPVVWQRFSLITCTISESLEWQLVTDSYHKWKTYN